MNSFTKKETNSDFKNKPMVIKGKVREEIH